MKKNIPFPPFPRPHHQPPKAFHVFSALLLLVLVFLFSPAIPARAATFTVSKTADTNDGTCDADCSLREAVVAANAAAGADTINFGVNGTFLLTLIGTAEDAAATGDLDITGDLTLTGNGQSLTIVDGNLTDRVFETRPAAAATLMVGMADLTVQRGSLGAGVANPGTGIAVDVVNTTGITNLTLADVTITNNTTGNNGGGISLTRQVADTSNPSLTLTNSTISGNSALNGGGIQCGGCDLTLNSSTISGNTVTTDGGGMNISGNTATVNLTNMTISNNTANDDGGGIARTLGTGTIALNFTTVTGNVADNDTSSVGDGGGFISTTGTASIQNSVIQGNTDNSTAGFNDCRGTITSSNFNVVGAGTGCPSGGANDSTAAASLGALADNGGPTLTHLPAGGSAAINRVTDGMSGCVGGTSVDQRGAVRAGGTGTSGSTACDSGSVEGDSIETPTAIVLRTLTARSPGSLATAGLAAISLLTATLLLWRMQQRKAPR